MGKNGHEIKHKLNRGRNRKLNQQWKKQEMNKWQKKLKINKQVEERENK